MSDTVLQPPTSADCLLTREATLRPAAEADGHVIEVVWSSGARVRRWLDNEVVEEQLDMSPGAVRLERLNAGAPFLAVHRAHDLDSVLGAVVPGSARLENGRGVARLRLSARAAVRPIVEDIRAGILRSVSVGYSVTRFERIAARDREDGGPVPLLIAREWQPQEISLVPIPADVEAQIRRARGRGAALPKERTMTTEVEAAPAEGAATQSAAPPAPAVRSAPAGDAAQIVSLCTRHAMPELAEELLQRGASLADARAAVLEQLELSDPMRGSRSSRVPHETTRGDAFAEAAIQSRLMRLGVQSAQASREAELLAELPLPELARRWLAHVGRHADAAGSASRALERALQTRAAVGYHSTSDFPAILAATLRTSVLDHYQAAASAFMAVSLERQMADFRPHSFARLAGSLALEKVPESGEYTYGSLGDTAEQLQLATYGRIFAITRQSLINDAENAFAELARILGTGTAETQARLFVGMIEANAGAGPTLSDGQPLFDAARGNVAEPGIPQSEVLAKMTTALRRQVGLGGEAISAEPRYIICPPELETQARKAVAEIHPTSEGQANPFAGRLEVLVEPRLNSTTRWFLATAPGRPTSLVHGFLGGARGPELSERVGFEIDGMEVKCRLDFTAGFVDHVGWITNPGAP